MKKNKVTALIFSCLLFLTGVLHAQIRVTGTVKDAQTGETLPGANVVIENTTTGVITNVDGFFTINVPMPNTTLVISYIGYVEQIVYLEGATQVDVNLVPDIKALQEVVVIGYGTQDARKVAGSISSVTADDMNKINATTLDLALQGRAAGLQIAATSGEANTMVRIRVRGNNSISGDNEPLIVLDGFPMFSVPGGSGSTETQQASPLSFINMDDVASVEILKDAAATAIYGSRGANGVILITTKQGTAGRPRIDFTAESYINERPVYPEMMNGPQYFAFGQENNRWQGLPAEKPDTITTRWIDRIFQRGQGQNYNMSISGGTRDSRYLVSGSFSTVDGVMLESGFMRGTVRANLNNRLSPKLTSSANLTFTQVSSDYANQAVGGTTAAGTIFSAIRSSPLVPAGKTYEEENPLAQEYITTPTNPLMNFREAKDKADQKMFLVNMTFDYDLLKDLKLTLRPGASFNFNNRERYWGINTGLGYNTKGYANLANIASSNYLVEAYGTYSKIINRHNVALVLGTSYQNNVSKNAGHTVIGFMSDGLGIFGLGGGLEASGYPYARTDRTIQSYFFRANYDYASKYIVSMSGRVDGSSVFAQENKYAFFPSIALAWRINEESFMKNVNFITELKLRGGYGQTGNQAIRPYESIAQFTFQKYLAGGSNEVFGISPAVMGNTQLRWETTEQISAGLDVKAFDGRVGLNLDYYHKTTHDLLLPFQLPISAGFTHITRNIGTLENKGLEITLSGEVINTGNFSWNTNLNYSRNRNLIVDIGEELEYIPGPIMDPNAMNENISGQFPGQPFSMFHGYIHTGLVQYHDFDVLGNPMYAMFASDRALGRQKFQDTNFDGVVNAMDRVLIGDPNPNFIFGFNNDLTYKRFSVNMFWQGSVGHDLFQASLVYTGTGFTVFNNTLDWYNNRWTEQNQHNDPRYPRNNQGAMFKPANTYIEDGSYVRLRNLSLRYSVPLRTVSIRSIELYVTGTNLLTFTKYSGNDPEVSHFGNRDDAIGVDFYGYPRVRVYTFGVKLGV